jgi:hypothetical protein
MADLDREDLERLQENRQDFISDRQEDRQDFIREERDDDDDDD